MGGKKNNSDKEWVKKEDRVSERDRYINRERPKWDLLVKNTERQGQIKVFRKTLQIDRDRMGLWDWYRNRDKYR